MADEAANRAAFEFQAGWCRRMTAPVSERLVAALIEAAGARATAARPLGWVAMEPSRTRDWFEVRVRGWPGGQAATMVAHTHPHAAWIEGSETPARDAPGPASGVPQ